jgi:predicted DNA-binding antitoxin AbrB/MazE fold protein
MQVATGTIIEGKVVLEGVSLPEGTAVTVFAKDSEEIVRLSPALQAELEEALEEADHEEGISGDELFRTLQKYG